MGDVIKFKKPDPRKKSDGRTLCASGFHKWEVMKEKRFDVKQGKLVTVERCKRCGVARTKFT